MAVDLSAPLYSALTGTSADMLEGLAIYHGAKAVFTKRPVPVDCGFPLIITAGYVTYGDQDFIDDEMADLTRDIAIYGSKPDHYRIVEQIGFDVRDLFHRKRESLIVSGWNVVDIRCSGPIDAPVDDDMTIGRIVTLRVRLTR